MLQKQKNKTKISLYCYKKYDIPIWLVQVAQKLLNNAKTPKNAKKHLQ